MEKKVATSKDARDAAEKKFFVMHWIESPVHRQNLYGPPFNTTGIGVARTPSGAWIFTQLYVTRPVEGAAN